MKTFFRKLDLSFGGVYSALLLVFVILLFAAVYKLGQEVYEQRLETAKLKSEAETLEHVRAEVLGLETVIKEIKEQSGALAGLVPTRKQFLQNIEQLEASAGTTANAQSISITEILPTVKRTTVKSPVSLPTKYDFANYNIELTGGYTNLVRYMKLLENEPFLMLVKNIYISADRQSVGNSTVNTGLLNSRIEGTFFFAKD